MFTRILLALSFFCSITRGEDPKPTLPEWHGSWSGDLVIRNSADKAIKVPVVLKIEPIKGSTDLTWKLSYDDNAKTVKDYKLVPDLKRGGRFVIDEGNGVKLDCRLVGTVMFCQFSLVGDPAVFSTRYELRGDKILFELTVSQPTSQTTGEGKVQSFGVSAVQSAELKKR